MQQGHVQQQSVIIPLQDGEIEGILALPVDSGGLVIFAHGSGSGRLSPRNNYVAQVLRAKGLGTLLIDLLSEEEDELYENRFDIELLARRLRDVTDWVLEDPQTRGLKIGYFGASTGAAAAFRAAAVLDGKIYSVVSRGGRPDLAMDFLDRVESPTLLIVGGDDRGVLELNKQALDEIQAEKDLVIVPHATHLFSEPGALRQVADLAACWFKKYIDGEEGECRLEPILPSRRRSVELAFMGDVMLGRQENIKLENRPPTYPWGDTLPVLGEADLRFCNLECVISDAGGPVPDKEYYFRSDVKNIDVLRVAGMDAVSLANNHTLDFGAEALLEMLCVLEENDIVYAGAGAAFDDAVRPVFLVARKCKVGFVAFTDTEPGWMAEEGKPGVFYSPTDSTSSRAKILFGAVEMARRNADVVVVSAHWGGRSGYEVPEGQIEFAHSLIDSGADIIYGHSPAVVRGIEIYNNRPILYSTGDFIDDYAINKPTHEDESFIFTVHIGNSGVRKIILYPTMIKNMEVLIAPSPEGREISAKITELSERFGTKLKWNKEKHYLEVVLLKG